MDSDNKMIIWLFGIVVAAIVISVIAVETHDAYISHCAINHGLVQVQTIGERGTMWVKP